MSVKAMTRVWELDLPHARQAVLLVMADHGNDEGASIFPSAGLIGWKCGYSKRQVQRIIDGMEADRLLIRVADARGYRPTEYRIGWDSAVEKPEYEASKKGRKPRGDTVSPQVGRSDVTPDDSTTEDEMSPQGATFSPERGDTQMSPGTLEPPGEPPTDEAADAASSSENGPTMSLRSRRDLTELSHRLAEGIRRNDGKAKVAPESKTWLEPLRLLLDVDRRSVEEVQAVIDFAVEDEFERRVVLSPQKLRKRFGELVQKAHAAAPATDGPVPISFRRSAIVNEFDPAWLAAHPPTPELVAEWAPIAAELCDAVDDGTYRIWLRSLHLHDAGEQLVIGVDGHAKGWVQDRFGRLIEGAAGKPYRLVVCGCERKTVAA